MDETLDLIQRLANERHDLYRLAGKQHLTVEEQARMEDISSSLPVLWDRYRREIAASHYVSARAPEHRQAA
jgi:hypothetical protein